MSTSEQNERHARRAGAEGGDVGVIKERPARGSRPANGSTNLIHGEAEVEEEVEVEDEVSG